jgi:hypothetical protein
MADYDDVTRRRWLLGLGFTLMAWFVVFLVLWHLLPCSGE